MITVIYQLVVPFPPKLIKALDLNYRLHLDYYAEYGGIEETALSYEIGTEDDESADVLTFSTEAEALTAETKILELHAKYLELASLS